jgi:cytochrome P450
MIYYLLVGVALFFAVYFLSLLFLNGGIRRNDEPVLLRGWIPHLGVFLEIGKKGFYNFFYECKQKYGSIFTVHLFGNRSHVVSDYKYFQQIQRKPTLFTIQPVFHKMAKLQGMVPLSEEQQEITRKLFMKEFEAKNLDEVSENFATFSLKRIEELFKEKQKNGFLEMDLYEFTRTVVYHGSSKAIFGEQYNAHATEDDLFNYDSGFFLIFMGIPIHYLKKTQDSRNKMIEYMKTLSIEQTTRFIKKIVETNDRDDNPERFLGALIASQTNSVNGSFWGLYNILKNPDVLKEATKEVESMDLSNYEESINQMKYLHGCFTETTRFNNSGISFREAVEDTSLLIDDKKYHIRKGDRIYMMPMEYENEEIFPNPEKFDPTRYFDTSKASLFKQVMTPFGGGIHMCPGRNFGINEMKLYCALILKYYNCEILSFPPQDLKKKAGFHDPLLGVKVKISKK